MKLSLLWEFLDLAQGAHKFYGDPLSRYDKKDSVPITHNSGFSGTSKSSPPKREKDDMSFLLDGTKGREKWTKKMGTKQ